MGSRNVRTGLLLVLLMMSTTVASQRISEEVEVMPDFMLRRILVDPYEDASNRLVKEGRIEQGVLSGAKQWSLEEPIRVCFFGGTPDLRRRIVNVASAWELPGTTIKFDFGDRNNPRLCGGRRNYDIRVGYSLPGYWSFIGQDSLIYAPQTEQSLNLARFDVSTIADAEFQRVVLHEFGHAIGLQHEHQIPDATCEAEFDWPVIYSKLSGPPNNWSKATIDFNMRSRPYFTGDIATDFNPKSIMLYSFPPSYYRLGIQSKCYTPQNTTISPGDVKTVSLAYGVGTPRNQTADYVAIKAAVPTLSAGEQEVVNRRLAFLQANTDSKASIIGEVRAEHLDVDVFSCNAGGATGALRDEVLRLLSSQPAIGRLRVRQQFYPNGETLLDGVSVIADPGHPEASQAKRIEAALEAAFPGRVKSRPNDGRVSPWYLSVVACER